MKSNSSWMKASLPQQQEFCLENNQLQLEFTTTEWEIYTNTYDNIIIWKLYESSDDKCRPLVSDSSVVLWTCTILDIFGYWIFRLMY